MEKVTFALTFSLTQTLLNPVVLRPNYFDAQRQCANRLEIPVLGLFVLKV